MQTFAVYLWSVSFDQSHALTILENQFDSWVSTKDDELHMGVVRG